MLDAIVAFFGGAFFINALPHLLAGLSGRSFPTPFANPPGRGESSSLLNVSCAAFNFAVAYGLLVHSGRFHIDHEPSVAIAALGGLLMGLSLALHFGRLYGGMNRPS